MTDLIAALQKQFSEFGQKLENMPNHIRADGLRDVADMVPAVLDLVSVGVQAALRHRADELDKVPKADG